MQVAPSRSTSGTAREGSAWRGFSIFSSNMMQQVGEGAVTMLLEKIENPLQALPSRAVPEVLLEGATCMPPRGPR
jgi:hypothetical protein